MTTIDKEFRIRTDFQTNLTFSSLKELLIKTASTFPFENLAIINNQMQPITKENLITKLLVNHEGGLCYELNPLLYYFLKENDWEVKLIRGVVYDHSNQGWSKTGNTHVLILLTHEHKQYIIDTGFGNNLPLAPVPLSGEIMTTENGAYHIGQRDGALTLEMKKLGDQEWKTGYRFDVDDIVKEHSDLDHVQQTIFSSPISPFNKKLIITQISEGGSLTLTEGSFTKNVQGKIEKKQISKEEVQKLAKLHFGLELA
ncbi:arylamine N-acetyltransferase family protein [Cytobacillus purgationiresistens]|uniref:N-hydroxyarylamine O-acetyltransferase n=1 Tax=Cytobacillus purgationiresistens TaxID=863449 RepID=A0ABU0AB82_9BACI|nr:arylamine N-acetyltransferase [Cytobacillus purgationiresistens]MDQ0268510.1 N-hydroxyarylamine O-acetyltransferase [Cytobacillus purgationiresistens]